MYTHSTVQIDWFTDGSTGNNSLGNNTPLITSNIPLINRNSRTIIEIGCSFDIFCVWIMWTNCYFHKPGFPLATHSSCVWESVMFYFMWVPAGWTKRVKCKKIAKYCSISAIIGSAFHLEMTTSCLPIITRVGLIMNASILSLIHICSKM